VRALPLLLLAGCAGQWFPERDEAPGALLDSHTGEVFVVPTVPDWGFGPGVVPGGDLLSVLAALWNLILDPARILHFDPGGTAMWGKHDLAEIVRMLTRDE